MPRLPRHWSLLVLLAAAPAYSAPVLSLYDWGSGTLQFKPAKDDANRQQGFLTGGECASDGSTPVLDAVWVDDLLVGTVRLCQTGAGCQARDFPLFAFFDHQTGSLVADVKLDKGCSSPALVNDRRLQLVIHKSQSGRAGAASGGSSHLAKGQDALNHADGRGALSEFRSALRAKEDKATAYLGIGEAQSLLGQRQSALDSYERSLKYRRDNATFYNIACVQVALNDLPGALENLQSAIDFGYVDLAHLTTAKDFEPLKRDPKYSGRFNAILRALAQRQPAAPR